MKLIQTQHAPNAIGPYSQAVQVSSLLFTSGQIALRPDGSMVEGGIEEQTQQVFHNLRMVIEVGGGSLSKVVKTTVYLKDMQDFPAMNRVYEAAFGNHRPARSTVEVSRLPRDALVEIEAIVSLL